MERRSIERCAALVIPVLVSSCIFVKSPSQVIKVPIGKGGVEVLWEVWNDHFDDGRYVLNVKTAHGSLSVPMWTESGASQRATFYRTTGGDLFVYGAFDYAMISLTPGEPPARITTTARLERYYPSTRWTYLGAVDGDSKLKLASGKKGEECLSRPTYPYPIVLSLSKRGIPRCKVG